MFEIFMFAANAVFPIILLIALGSILKKTHLIDKSFMVMGNRLIFKIMLPLMIFYNIYNIPDISSINWSIVIFSLSAISAFFILGLLTVSLLIKNRSSKGVVLQCVFRSNFAIIGVPLAYALGGSSGSAATALLIAFTIPLFNVLAVISLSIYSVDGSKKRSVVNIVLDILKNPLIIAAFIGLLTLFLRSLIPLDSSGELVFSLKRDLPFLYNTIKTASEATTFLSLIVLGGLLDFSAVKGKVFDILVATSWRVILAPILGITAAILFEKAGILSLSSGEYAALLALFGSPVAVSSAIMAAEMDADADLARQLVVWTSLCPIVTIFTFVVILRSMGIL